MTRRAFVASVMAAAKVPRLTGTFLQLNQGHLSWPDSKWEMLFDCFAQLRLKRLVIQWAQDEETLFLDLLPMIFDRAGKAEMRVHLGLLNARSFWSMNDESAERILSSIYEQTVPLIRQLAPLARRKEFSGWYIPQEFDDVRWSRKNMRRNGGDFIRATAKALRKVAPRSHVSLSAFANGHLPPEELAHLWHDVFRFAKVDELLFQDGIGVHKLTLDRLPAYEKALRKRLGARFTPVIEIFEQTGDDPFAAIPASAERVRRQLAIASAAIAFSIPEYMTPLGGEAAAALFEEFVHATSAR